MSEKKNHTSITVQDGQISNLAKCFQCSELDQARSGQNTHPCLRYLYFTLLLESSFMLTIVARQNDNLPKAKQSDFININSMYTRQIDRTLLNLKLKYFAIFTNKLSI